MPPRPHPAAPAPETTRYVIVVRGDLDARWSDRFAGLDVSVAQEGGPVPLTTLAGAVADQAALRGLLNQLWDLNLTLISVTQNATLSEPEAHHDR